MPIRVCNVKKAFLQPDHIVDRNELMEEQCPFKDQLCPLRDEIDRLQGEVRRLDELSQTDPLTGVYNVRYFMSALEGEMERTRRTGMATALVFIDLDHFKRVNDTYGHDAGNEALRWASRIWKKILRQIDIICRYGGEEFAVILPGTRLNQAIVAAERLRAGLQNSPVVLKDARVTLTASFGVDVYMGTESMTVRGLISRADKYLLNAKEQGRNCVMFDRERVSGVSTEVSVEEREKLVGPIVLEE
jgi:diguanylate cyclase (GGDEF)-like protein